MNGSMTVVLTFSWASEPPDDLLKRIARHHPQSFRFSRSRWSLRISVPNRFSSIAHAVSWGPYFEKLVAAVTLEVGGLRAEGIHSIIQ